MNVYAIMLCLLAAYLWQAGSLTSEIKIIKRLLVTLYDIIESKTNQLTDDMFAFKNELVQLVNRLHNNTVELIMNNTNKIDMISDKIDVLLTR
ncbi:GP16 [Trabala vishnou gigantina nucleopolyhedrovirus]|uniref:GP16 n=1 Tax=Trabala vishnou gigantina nucleopolyhedrovirus TaxID=2863583 RepID=UPI0024819B1E|nr:GP16 [Trabala vishnou gigantina nucleopolyhedrovirus]QYC92778.1 GP16 [Trabala vishnou gigantina nucleopolyhedrovirus]